MATTSSAASLIELYSVPPSPDHDQDHGQDQEQGAHHNVEAELCERCRQFDIQTFGRSQTRSRGYLLIEVKTAANVTGGEGVRCAFCSLLWDSVGDIARPKDATESEINVLRLPIAKPDMYVHMTLSQDYADPKSQVPALGLGANRLRTAIADRFSEVRNESDHELCLAAELDSPAARNGDIAGRYLGSDPSSAAHFDTIRAWIDGCSTHTKCNQTVSGYVDIRARQSPLPARCIEISKGDSGLQVRLSPTEGLHGTYITLTHRWNDETESCKTTQANCLERQQGMDLEILPKVFRDVFAIAAELDVQYVWIDSLCIIQSGDDGEDWRKEAPKMAQYYQFSLLTVAGTMSDITAGLLSPYAEDYEPWESELVELPYRDKTGAQAGHFYIYKRQVTLMEDYWASVRESILFRRGWILQEWLLSKRILWYTSRGLFFECHTDGPRTEYQEKIIFENAKDDLRLRLQLKGSFHFDSTSILDFRYRAIEAFSRCHLTKPDQDRILAVAGLAKEVGLIIAKKMRKEIVDGIHDEVYTAGLWFRDIHYGLLWEEDHSAPQWTVSVDQAPSWSWASLMTPVRWAERDEGAEKDLRVEGFCQRRRDNHKHQPDYIVKRDLGVRALIGDGGMQRAQFDPTNMFTCLHIRGKLHAVHLRGYLETEKNVEKAALATAYGTSPKNCQWRALCSPSRPEVIVGWASVERLRDRDDESLCADAGIAFHALLVSTRFVRSGVLLKSRDPVLDVLLLEEVDGGSHVFRRSGVGRVFDTDLVRLFQIAEDSNIQLV